MSLDRHSWAFLLVGVALACQGVFDNPAEDVTGEPDQTRFLGAGVGEVCGADDDCRAGLSCAQGSCAALGEAAVNDKCLLSAECGPGLNCGWSGFCTAAGSGLDECSSASDCARGQYCELISFSGSCAEPAADAGDLGTACQSAGDCLAGLACSAVSHTCVAGALLLNPDLYIGTACPDESSQPFGVRMALPSEHPDADFYAFPFPSDVRLAGGSLDLGGHPRPGPGFLGFDLVGAVIDALQADAKGFSVYPLVFLRFTRPVDPASLVQSGGGATVHFVELPSGAPVPFTFAFSADAGKYICGNRLAIRPGWSQPLKPLTTYAVVVTRGVRSQPAVEGMMGEEPEALDELAQLLAGAAPAAPGVQAAWATFAPLRAWLGAGTIPVDSVAGATVFTTGDPTSVLRQLRAAALAAPAPTVVPGSVTVCKAGVKSPCATPNWASTPKGQAGGDDPRDCPKGGPVGYQEIHLKLRLPTYQDGERPYLSEGGSVHVVDGKPAAQGTEEVCAAVTVPVGNAPAKGWPLLLYAHGTGGSFRTGAGAYGKVSADNKVATLGIDQPMHGDRRGLDADPGPLFYNYANPRAARGNLVQGAADNFALVRFAKAFDDVLGAAGRVAFDDTRLVYMGHSQGATTGPLFLPYEDDLQAAVLTGAGGSLVEGLLGKQQPYDSKVGISLGLQEVDLDAWHPVLGLIEYYFDATEPALYATKVFAHPEGKALSVLNVVGWDDHYAPWHGGVVFAASLGGNWGLPDHVPAELDLTGFDPVGDLGLVGKALTVQGVSGNVTVAGQGTVTGFSVAWASDGSYDGHFVGTRNPGAQKQIATFLADVFAGKVPRVVK